MRYMWWGNTHDRWTRILYALENEDALVGVLA
jgi:hypothetical protein